MTPRGSRAGFTLVEMLVTLAILAMLLGALGGLLTGASQVFKMLNARNRAALEHTVIALEKAVREIQASPVYPDVAFEGSKDRLAFPKITALSNNGKPLRDFKLGQAQTVILGQSFACRRIEYYFDAEKHALMRRMEGEDPEEMLGGLETVEFSYAVKSSEGSSWRWMPQTPKGPDAGIGAVTVRVRFDSAFYPYSIPGIQKTFLILRGHPVGAVVQSQEAPVIS